MKFLTLLLLLGSAAHASSYRCDSEDLIRNTYNAEDMGRVEISDDGQVAKYRQQVESQGSPMMIYTEMKLISGEGMPTVYSSNASRGSVVSLSLSPRKKAGILRVTSAPAHLQGYDGRVSAYLCELE